LYSVSHSIRFDHSEFYCHRFLARAVERFTGPFDHVLANPIIIIGNKVCFQVIEREILLIYRGAKADPTTPFANAQKIADTLGSSARLLKQDAFGVGFLPFLPGKF